MILKVLIIFVVIYVLDIDRVEIFMVYVVVFVFVGCLDLDMCVIDVFDYVGKLFLLVKGSF